MANRETVIRTIEEKKIIVIIRGLDPETLKKTVGAMIDGGIGLVELPFDQSGKTSDEETAENIRMLKKAFPDKLCVGAGTVLTVEEAELAAEAGAEYIVSPDTYEPVIKKTRELGLISIPGAFTPTEATNAHRWGADFVKLFPNSEIEPSYLRALVTPLSHIKFLAVGGVTLDSIRPLLDAGARGFGIASAIADKKKIAAGDFAGITAVSKRFVEAVNGKKKPIYL